MEKELLQNIILFAIPSLITAALAYYLFASHFKNEEQRRRHNLQKKASKQIIPIRLQAYERLVLFLERIRPSKLLVRIKPENNSLEAYEDLVIDQIEQEYAHNLAQQIYVSEACWNTITASKNATIQLIRKAALLEKTTSADKLREVVIRDTIEKSAPSDAALAYIRVEVDDFINF